ncbi:mCG147007 [Mus musculus]|jgi:hypothetical protein|nr:mCG147007 [Mus musculus]
MQVNKKEEDSIKGHCEVEEDGCLLGLQAPLPWEALALEGGVVLLAQSKCSF